MEIPITNETAQKAAIGVGGAIMTGLWFFIKRHLKLEREALLVDTNNRITVIEVKLEAIQDSVRQILENQVLKPPKRRRK